MSDWTGSFAALAGLDDASRQLLQAHSQPVRVAEGTVLFREGSPCQAYLFVLEGQIRVQKVGENGREITLYRVEAGETCIVTTACLMSGTDYDAEGVAETAIAAQALPIPAFRQLLATSAAFRDFVFRAYGSRIADLLLLIEEVSFGRIDQRLAACLLQRARGQSALSLTHQEVAAELGSAREVISRQLKDFERRGWIQLGRGQLQLLDSGALQQLAGK
ncbi:Crp/Fnr family transcriptional regulator [Aquitalea palustris]|uniref:Crp/Fnr family transcriptional regulator n=1 Tax=Aquitalea palustris TaxID=2480983 RepID=A0A454JJ58_9NEIS|nr:Crp/Fnr family transcriptional regulator [Aquitalea palustris]RMC98806.1 Crp/Fnr family transcriptional regulator [Aquitalea palustris]